MKAVRFHGYGDADVLHVEEVPVPEPGAGEVRVRVAASAFNPVDAGIRGGWVRDAFPIALPHVPGYDVSGVVDAVGDGVIAPAVGDAVVGFLSMTADGGAAEQVVAPAADWVAAPTAIPLVDAAALPSAATTAWQALFDAAGLTAGQRLLVNGAGGTVGLYAVQLAARAGVRVVAATGPSGRDAVSSAGAAEVVDHAALSDVAPVDAALNLGPVGPDGLAALTALVRDGGVVVNTVPSIPTPGDPARGVRGVPFFVHADTGDLARLVAMVDAGELRVDVAERRPLADLPDVHARSDRGELRGKVVLLPPTA